MKKLLAVSLLTLGLGLSFSPASQAATTEAQTKHPIVLVPGIFAFDSIASIDYWYKIPAALQSQGATVFVPKINAFDSSAKRGEALIAQLDNIRASSAGKISKFNLMGHSHGGPDARQHAHGRAEGTAHQRPQQVGWRDGGGKARQKRIKDFHQNLFLMLLSGVLPGCGRGCGGLTASPFPSGPAG